MNGVQRLFHRPFFIKLFNWEYWSFTTVYCCIYPVWLLFCLRCRSLFFFAASNPGIKYGGFLSESKKDIAAIIPPELQPGTIFFPANPDTKIVLNSLREQGFTYPMIGKPDVGGRGRGVKVLRSETDVIHYAERINVPFHIQEWIDYPCETGIFYVRFPDQEKGKVTGIVRKEFLTVTGNGKNTLRELLLADRRAIMYMKGMEKIHGPAMEQVLAAGERKVVSPYGNHSRGSKFLDDSHLIDETLHASVDAFCQRIPGFYYGRIDIRYKEWDTFKHGKDFKIIEVNGAGSEPTHIYDPSHSLFFAWKEIIRHWRMLARISRINHRKGHPYLGMKDGLQMFREEKAVNRVIGEV